MKPESDARNGYASQTRGKTTWKTVLEARDLRHNETSAEDLLWNELCGKRLHGLRFRRQHPIGHFVMDFFCVQIQLAVELDGCVHRQSDQAAYDEERTSFLEEQGIYVLRFATKKFSITYRKCSKKY
jgi:very-short-patch-repair endonuclease